MYMASEVICLQRLGQISAAVGWQVTDVEVNHGMFVRGVEGIEAAGAPLQHVQFVVRRPLLPLPQA